MNSAVYKWEMLSYFSSGSPRVDSGYRGYLCEGLGTSDHQLGTWGPVIVGQPELHIEDLGDPECWESHQQSHTCVPHSDQIPDPQNYHFKPHCKEGL